MYRHVSDTVYLLLYVDDIVLIASSTTLLQRVISLLASEFSMKDLGALHHFLSMSVTRNNNGLLLSQGHYILEILERDGMSDYNPTLL